MYVLYIIHISRYVQPLIDDIIEHNIAAQAHTVYWGHIGKT